MKTRYLVSISLVLGVAAAGCSSNGSGSIANLTPPMQSSANANHDARTTSVNWLEFGFVPSGGRFNPHERTLWPRNAHRLHKRWSRFTGCNGSICGGSSVAVVNGTAYVGSYDGHVYALEAATGAKRWSFATRLVIDSSPAVAKGTV